MENPNQFGKIYNKFGVNYSCFYKYKHLRKVPLLGHKDPFCPRYTHRTTSNK